MSRLFSTRFCSRFLRSFCTSETSVYLRHVSPIRENRDILADNLFHQIQNQEKYSFAKKDDISEIAQKLHNGEECLNLVESWMSNVSLAFHLVANKDKFQEILPQVIRKMSAEFQNGQEMVALWLCIYFSKRLWSTEELYEYLGNDFDQICLH